MEKAEGKRKAESEDEGVQKQPRLGSDEEISAPEVAVPPPVKQYDPLGRDEETSAPEVAVPPPVKQQDPLGRYVYELGENLTPRYIIMSKIGEGAYSVVLECWDREAWETVAIKVSRSTRDSQTVKYEIALLQRLAAIPEARSSIVQMRHWFEHEKHYCIVFESLGPSIREFQKKNNRSPVPVDLVRIFGRQLLEAVAHLHDLQVIHTDLKPQNILLVSPDYVELPARESCSSDEVQLRYLPKSSAIKLIDFGSSIHDRHRIQAKNLIGVVITRHYRAPEIVLGLDWTFPCDIWSVGCILAELCTGRLLFNLHKDLDMEHLASMERVLGHLPKDMTQRAMSTDPPPPHFCQETGEDSGTGWTLNWPQGASSTDSINLVNNHCPLQESVSRHVQSSKSAVLIDLLNGLLKYEPSERLTARNALEHPFFKNPP